jgi:putative flavoprotein involved in K+ transport
VTSVPGLYVRGLPWLYTWGSGRFSGVARDTLFLAEQIEARAAARRPAAEPALAHPLLS